MTSLTDLNNAVAAVGEVPCQNAPDMFFPDLAEDVAPLLTVKYAQQLCQSCPVINTCLQYALDNDEREGVWGGMAAGARTKLKRARRRAVPASASTLVSHAS